jgi:hypothetical protein
MARKLPWTSEAEPSAKRQKTVQAVLPDFAPADRNARQSVSAQGERGHGGSSTPRRRRRRSRTPSNSPPPAPAPTEPMITGYDADDVWMMVEDEFQSLAQSFTRHLHHAAYKEMVKKAKEQPRKALPEPTSPMSKKTKQRLQRESLADKQQEGLQKAIPGIDTARASDTAGEPTDPWRGTALAGLMATSSQERTSLKGLDRMPSSTKAASGYSRSDISKSRNNHVRATRRILESSMSKAATSDTHDSRKQKAGTKETRQDRRDSNSWQRDFQSKQEEDIDPLYSTRGPRNSDSNNYFSGLLGENLLEPGRRKKPVNKSKQAPAQKLSARDRLEEVPMFLG